MDTTLTADVGAVLNASGLREAPAARPATRSAKGTRSSRCPSAGLAGRPSAGTTQTPCIGCPALDLCRTALASVGYRVEIVHATVIYLAVLRPPGR